MSDLPSIYLPLKITNSCACSHLKGCSVSAHFIIEFLSSSRNPLHLKVFGILGLSNLHILNSFSIPTIYRLFRVCFSFHRSYFKVSGYCKSTISVLRKCPFRQIGNCKWRSYWFCWSHLWDILSPKVWNHFILFRIFSDDSKIVRDLFKQYSERVYGKEYEKVGIFSESVVTRILRLNLCTTRMQWQVNLWFSEFDFIQLDLLSHHENFSGEGKESLLWPWRYDSKIHFKLNSLLFQKSSTLSRTTTRTWETDRRLWSANKFVPSLGHLLGKLLLIWLRFQLQQEMINHS